MSAQDRFKRKTTAFFDNVDNLARGMDLDAMIMLSMTLERSDGVYGSSEPSKHTIYLSKRGTATYTTLSGKMIKFVEESGMLLPEQQKIAEIELYTPEQVSQDPEQHPLPGLIRKNDEHPKGAYAPVAQVREAFKGVLNRIKELESTEVDIKSICPEAKTNIKSLTVSVEDFGTYFNAFQHAPNTSLPNNYRTNQTKSTDIVFLPANVSVQLLVKKYAC